MFENFNNDHSEKEEFLKQKFTILYDKLTKPVAVSLRNTISKDFTCAIWDQAAYKGCENKISNKNYFIILDGDLIKINLANPKIKPIDYTENVSVLLEGNTIGFVVKEDNLNIKFSDVCKKGWPGFLAEILPVGFVLAPAYLIYMFMSNRNKLKVKYLFDACEKFKKESLENFINGKGV